MSSTTDTILWMKRSSSIFVRPKVAKSTAEVALMCMKTDRATSRLDSFWGIVFQHSSRCRRLLGIILGVPSVRDRHPSGAAARHGSSRQRNLLKVKKQLPRISDPYQRTKLSMNDRST